MVHLKFPPHFKHDHEPVKNVNLLHDEQLTVSQRTADRIEAHNDYIINQKVEVEVGIVLEHLETQNIALQNILELLNSGDGGRESGR